MLNAWSNIATYIFTQGQISGYTCILIVTYSPNYETEYSSSRIYMRTMYGYIVLTKVSDTKELKINLTLEGYLL